ncbi:MAG: hypothetical protein ACYSXF_09220 [Planctomycetota bacterium]|jgi:hypothetical protein
MKYLKPLIVGTTVCLVLAPAASQVTPPASVQGKEHSNNVDEDATGAVDFLQNIEWDNPLAPTDTFDYSNTGIIPTPLGPAPPLDPDQVDALANHQDHLFAQVVAGTVPIVVSFESDPPSGFTGDDIYFHTTAGATGVWAVGPLDINVPVPPDDVDAVELWGLPVVGQQHDPMSMGTDDANNYSYIGDCVLPMVAGMPIGAPKIIVFYFDPVMINPVTLAPGVSTVYITHDELRDRLVQAYSDAHPGNLDVLPGITQINADLQVDIDALMVFDQAGNGIWEDGDTIIFSLRPTTDSILICAGPPAPPFPSSANPFDGGEIWVWTRGAADGLDGMPGTPDDNPAFLPAFLVHGGRTWDIDVDNDGMTTNDMNNIFGVPTENIDALEAVEEEAPPDGEGCTPGYWKQPQHFDSWTAPYTPKTLFSDVFEDAFPGLTLLDVLNLGGGMLNALGRHTVAALLNGASAGVNYGLTDAEVIDLFNDVFPGSDDDYEALKDFFESLNERDCPLNGDNDGLLLTAPLGLSPDPAPSETLPRR